MAQREKAGQSDESLEEKDFKLRSVKDFTKSVRCHLQCGCTDPRQVAQQIDVAVHDHADLVPEIQMLYERAGIVLPSPSVPRAGGKSLYSV